MIKSVIVCFWGVFFHYKNKWCLSISPAGSPLNRSNSNTGLYAKACSTIAEDSGTGLIDLWTLMQEDKVSVFNFL